MLWATGCCILLQASLLAAAAPVKLHYAFTPQISDNRLTLHVDVSMDPRKATLVLPSSWGDAANLQNSITHLQPASASTAITATADPLKKMIRGGSKTQFSYDLVNDWEGPLREAVRHRAHLDPAYLEINASNAFVQPELPPDAIVDCTLDWKLPANWTIATSFGTGNPRQHFRGAWNEFQNALFVAGDFRLHSATLGKGTLMVAVRGGFSDDDVVQRVSRLLRLEREFWRDDHFPYFLVTLVPSSGVDGSSGGSAFTNAFSLQSAPERGFTPEMTSLLAHEIFHTWNPMKLGVVADPEQTLKWFTEGFTTYYQDLLLWRAGLLSFPAYLETVNVNIRDYFLSREKNITLADFIESGKKGGNGRIAYTRGAVTALWLDAKIRANTHSKTSLDDVMFHLFHHQQAELTSQRIYDAIAKYLPADELRVLRDYVERGTTIDVPEGPFGKCVVRETVEVVAFELGMDPQGVTERQRVEKLQPGSEAAKAGLREGDKLTGMSFVWNDTANPVKFTVARGGQTLQFRYLARGPSLGTMPHYKIPDPQNCPGPEPTRTPPLLLK